MLNLFAAALITITITGTPIAGEIVEILDYRTDDSGAMVLDVRLADGTLVESADALDVALIAPAPALAVVA